MTVDRNENLTVVFNDLIRWCVVKLTYLRNSLLLTVSAASLKYLQLTKKALLLHESSTLILETLNFLIIFMKTPKTLQILQIGEIWGNAFGRVQYFMSPGSPTGSQTISHTNTVLQKYIFIHYLFLKKTKPTWRSLATYCRYAVFIIICLEMASHQNLFHHV